MKYFLENNCNRAYKYFFSPGILIIVFYINLLTMIINSVYRSGSNKCCLNISYTNFSLYKRLQEINLSFIFQSSLYLHVRNTFAGRLTK